MLDQWLRKLKDQVFGQLFGQESLLRVTPPLALTGVGFGIGLGSALAASQHQFAWSLGLWWLNRLFDGLDGTAARLQNRQTDLGGYLDLLLDVVIYTAVPLGVAHALNSLEGYRAVALLLGSFYINLCGLLVLSGLLEKNQRQNPPGLTSIPLPSGLIEGAETIVCYSLFLLWPHYAIPLFYGLALLVGLTAMQRLVLAIRIL